ncbi:SH3 domain-containing protein [Merismopedia glauca]|uniref:SH3b domain-containing protein n=1 Tax=Merismopedia glauca CCAP 1448/3 TaxID=1296344 RepID=A0A2T1C783_9CYAN|nr:SH3 domain-containing protein [Merismopedia glauca]PSB03997.1 hypothetical protein C7B64_06025 [Merismopedia glauca CCAP 1448/3]
MSQNLPQDANLDQENDKLLSVPVNQGYASTYPQKSSQTMWTGLLKLVIGILVGLTLLVGIGSGIGYYFINRLTNSPPKPRFSEEQKTATKKVATVNSSQQLPPGAYRGRVVPRKGLSLRAEPNQSAEKLAVASYNQEVIVLKSGEDRDWVRIRVKETKKEGWVRASNIEKLDVPKPKPDRETGQ